MHRLENKRRGWLWSLAVCTAALLGYQTQRVLPHFVASDNGARTVGVYHLHTDASHDSHVSQADYVTAARVLGLQFVILTDHNAQTALTDDAHDSTQTRAAVDTAGPAQTPAAQPPANVRRIAAPELSTPFGHVISLGASRLMPPEARGGADVLQQIKAYGGAALVAHPSDAKRPWTGPYPVDGGIEIANWSASVRREVYRLWPQALALVVTWFVNRPLVLAQAYDHDVEALALWDHPAHAKLVGLCGIDAHGWIAPADNLAGWHIVLDTPQAHEREVPSADAITTAIRGGHFFCTAGLLGRAPALRFGAARQGQLRAGNGDAVAARNIDSLVVEAPNLSVGTPTLVVRHNGVVVHHQSGPVYRLAHPAPGIWRAEVWAALPQVVGLPRDVPVLYTNTLTLTD